MVTLFVLSNCFSSLASVGRNLPDASTGSIQSLTMDFFFSEPTFTTDSGYVRVHVDEADMNLVAPGKPVLPVNTSIISLEFGTEIVDVKYQISSQVVYTLSSHKLPFGGRFLPDIYGKTPVAYARETRSNDITNLYPKYWISYHTGGGLSFGEHVTYLVLNVYPVRYNAVRHEIHFISHITVTVNYKEPEEPLLDDHSIYDLLILAPSKFSFSLKPLVEHKNAYGVKTMFVSVEEVYDRMFWYGRDEQEKIKYFIKHAVEHWGVTYVLLVGGMKGQTDSWYLPVRYSHVVSPDEQGYAEPFFISDLYYADIYDALGGFSSWDSNNNNVFAEWNDTHKDEMDLYPDVYLGRLACRNVRELKTVVEKIITYENNAYGEDWFNNFLVVAGDSYNDTEHFNEGELIGEAAIECMPGFTPVRVYASQQDINWRNVNRVLNKGCGFAYFCGHGSPVSWNTHYPPDGTKWCTGYNIKDMLLLHNKEKLPIVIVGGCHNAQFDVSLLNLLKGLREEGLSYFRVKPPVGGFWYGEWSPECWAWFLTSKRGGGAVATIANTGVGAHGEGDVDSNGVPDYLEILDGWLELRFFQLYGVEHVNVLGEVHGETLTGYLHRFLGNNEKMDVKMVQQWELFGDPSLKIGGRCSLKT